ncbi:MAG TPA: APC family permease [Candidatus Sulfomarinibacteraceae bacterium]|nr:APC family permease [Candidatus Sulfomarinibacteraceae bacterium]
MIGGRRPGALRGRKVGDRRIRVERPHTAFFRYTGPNQLVAKAAASAPRTPLGLAAARVRAALFGRPLSTHEEIEERLPKKKALAIFSSDPISSSAYATEEILRVLVLAGTGALLLSLPIAVAIALLLAVVSTSYRQIGYAYPSGGGAYAVARANLGRTASLVAAGALLVDYIMTVAVSTASAVEQITSAVPELFDERILIGLAAILLITVGNLRGLRESGNIFALPTYLFVGSALLMIAIGTYRIVVLGEGGPPPSPLPGAPDPLQAVGFLLIIRAFASGSVALTGTEAIANGVPAFKPPEPINAAKTLTAVAILLAILFIGITFVAHSFGLVPVDEPVKRTVISQVAATVYGDGSIGFYLFQTFTALILFLAANTSYNAFPRLAAILAEDGFMPRQFAFRGDRLAFTAGVVILSTVAIGLLVAFAGDTHALIPLYSVGVFVSFTISQAGMVRHWRRERTDGWRWRLAINGFGCALTGVVAVIVTVAKAPESLLVAVVIPILVGVMLFINLQYRASRERLAVREDGVLPSPRREERVIVPVPGINRAVVQAVNVGRSIAPDVRAVLISADPDEAAAIRHRWERQMPDVPLVVVESPYRALVGPLVAYLDVADAAWPPDKEAPITFVVIPEYVAGSWWERLLYNQSAKRLRAALLGRPHTVVVNVPYRRDDVEGDLRGDAPTAGSSEPRNEVLTAGKP